jgi:L-amino acid N-acyltransferase YncA
VAAYGGVRGARYPVRTGSWGQAVRPRGTASASEAPSGALCNLAAVNAALSIREARPGDWDSIWPFFHQIVAARETYAYDPAMTKAEGRTMWMVEPPARTVVATQSAQDGVILGTASMYANRQGRGSHVASASFMVDPQHGGKGVGRALGEDVIEWARRSGFRAIQFNAVVETNAPAVALWRSLGFEVVGRVPEAFDHPRHGYVGLLIMHRFL